jgi:predicted nucleic acid-binding protein
VYLLDSDILGFTLSDPERYPLLIENLDASDPSERWISIITAQELIAWRYNPLLKTASQQPPAVLRAYHNFLDILVVLCELQIKQFDASAMQEFRKMRGAGNIGARDRRIAAIALSSNLTVVTNNESDFVRIQEARPELIVENWTKQLYFPRV